LAKNKLAILGCGNMGGAILKAIVETKLIKENLITIFDIEKSISDKYNKELSVNVSANEIDLVKDSDFILLAIKPQFMAEVLDKVKSGLKSEEIATKTIISIAAGLPISFFEEKLGKKIPVIRVMPNILALVNSSASALTSNGNVNKTQMDFALSIFNGIGTTVIVKEELIDVVTGLSGSGPAYIAIMIEALADGAVKMGLPRDIAYKLAIQTVSGTGKYLSEKNVSPGVFKDMVSSPGGTTIAAIHALEKGNFRATIMSAVEAATLRAKELGKK
jgi:pyrroline-5-carboxylate reductase